MLSVQCSVLSVQWSVSSVQCSVCLERLREKFERSGQEAGVWPLGLEEQIQKYRKTGGHKDWKTGTKETGRQRDRKRGRQDGRKTERQTDSETKSQEDRKKEKGRQEDMKT